jgi:hypothetical protein
LTFTKHIKIRIKDSFAKAAPLERKTRRLSALTLDVTSKQAGMSFTKKIRISIA